MTAKVSKKNSFSTLSYQVLWLGSGIRPPRTIPLGPETYQDLVEKWIKAAYYQKYFSTAEACKNAGFNLEDKKTIQALGLELSVEKDKAIEKGLVKYTTIVNGSGMYEISVPYGIYYVLIKSKNRELPTVLEYKNRYHMQRVHLNSPTQIISFDFDIPLTDL